MVRSKSQVLLTCPGANQMVRGCPQSPLASETCQAPEINHPKVVFGSPRCGKKYGSVMKYDGYIGSLINYIKSIHPAKQYLKQYQQDMGGVFLALPVDHIPVVAPPTARALPRCRNGRNPEV